VEQAPVREDRAHHGLGLHRGDAPQPAATARGLASRSRALTSGAGRP